MRVPYSVLFFFLLLSFSVNGVKLNETHRRILYQPLFPETPPPDAPVQPFFPENQLSPPASSDVNGGLPIPTATPTQPAKPGKRIAIVGIGTLGMLSALAFFLYRHKVKHAGDTQKLDAGSRIFHEDPTFLYMGTG